MTRLKMSSAKWRLVIILSPMLTVPLGCSEVSVMILSRNMLKRMGESRHSCQTQTVVQNQPALLPLRRTALVALLQGCLMTQIRLAPVLYFLMVACQTLLKSWGLAAAGDTYCEGFSG